jgi:hypothetical protein
MEKSQSFDLRLEKYCEFCPDFEADVEKIDITVMSDPTQKVLTTIRCEHSGRCERIMARAKEMANEEAEKI